MASVFQQVLQVQQLMQNVLLRLPNVVGVAVGMKESGGVLTDLPALVVLVERKKPQAALSESQIIPSEIDGVTTDVYEAGVLMAQQAINPKARFRPTIPAGVSLGHYKVSAGTFGIPVKDRTTGETLILSNNHVLADSNEALPGDPILQPGATDGGQNPADMIAKLERFIPLNYLEGPVAAPTPPETPTEPTDPAPTPPTTQPPTTGNPPPTKTPTAATGCDVVDLLVNVANLLAVASGSERRVQATASAQSAGAPAAAPVPGATNNSSVLDNVLDAALARPLNPASIENRILEIGTVIGTAAPALNMNIRKFGRTTGLTTSQVTLLNATVNVGYNTSVGARTARFTGQVICNPMSQGGDSGSLIVDDQNRAVGLLFGGSPLATLFTPIDTVLNALNVDLLL